MIQYPMNISPISTKCERNNSTMRRVYLGKRWVLKSFSNWSLDIADLMKEGILFHFYKDQSPPGSVWYFLKAGKTDFLLQFFFISFGGADLEI